MIMVVMEFCLVMGGHSRTEAEGEFSLRKSTATMATAMAATAVALLVVVLVVVVAILCVLMCVPLCCADVVQHARASHSRTRML